MTDRKIINELFKRIKTDIKDDQIAKNIRASGESADSIRGEISEDNNSTIGLLFGRDYLLNQEKGSPKGTRVPFGKLYQWSIHRDIKPRGKQPRSEMVKAMQHKIFTQGTDVYLKKRQGLALTDIIQHNIPEALEEIRKSKGVEFLSDFVKVLRK